MSKLRIFYIASLLILGALLVGIFYPMGKNEELSELTKSSFMYTDNEYLVEFDITNHKDMAVEYIINALIDGETDSRSFTIQEGRTATYVYHLYPDRIREKEITFTIYKEGEVTPCDQVTYHIK